MVAHMADGSATAAIRRHQAVSGHISIGNLLFVSGLVFVSGPAATGISSSCTQFIAVLAAD
jgi:hypothetical protein